MSHTWDHPNADPIADVRAMTRLYEMTAHEPVRQIWLPGSVIDAHGGIEQVTSVVRQALNTEVTVYRIGDTDD